MKKSTTALSTAAEGKHQDRVMNNDPNLRVKVKKEKCDKKSQIYRTRA